MKNIGIEDIKIASIELLPVFAMRELKKIDIDSLAASIKEHGLINPLLVRARGKGYELISGHRRYLALQKIKAKTAPAHVIDVDDQRAFVLALTENMERKDPEPLEEANAFRRAVNDLKMQVKDIAKQINMSPSYVSNRMRLLDLCPNVQDALKQGEITAGHCEHGFLRLNNKEDQEELLNKFKNAHRWNQILTVKDVAVHAKDILADRKKIDALDKYLSDNNDRIKYPICPKCKSKPDPNSHHQDLKTNILGCPSYHEWNAIKGPITHRETTLDGNYTTPKPGGENVVKVESCNLKSRLSIQQFAALICQKILASKAKAIESIAIDDTEIHFCLEDSIGLPEASISKMGDTTGKSWKTDITVSSPGWGSNNDDIIEERESFWKLETEIDKNVVPAEIIRHPLQSLIVDHKGLKKGTELNVLRGAYEGNWKIIEVHRDYTAYAEDPDGAKELLEEKELRKLIKDSCKKKTVKAVKPKAKTRGKTT